MELNCPRCDREMERQGRPQFDGDKLVQLWVCTPCREMQLVPVVGLPSDSDRGDDRRLLNPAILG